ncbi:NACHT, LRR and PYD domains-containing protein 3-like [Paramisgurnus dabryanus]|uniref:NACHT, LRR and PYD domains-containing protein 3-like n=1 Tax=Paramisgurnus dabryanus TaxID=90735 RepID=UPI0031F35244
MDRTQKSTERDFSPGDSLFHRKGSDPGLSCVSMKSCWSMEPPLKFKSEDTKRDLSSVHRKRSDSELSCVSMKSNWSMEPPATFKSEDTRPDLSSVHQKRSDPAFSSVSMKSSWSMEPPLKFKTEDTRPDLSSVHQKRSDPELSCVSMKSSWSMEPPLKFKSEETRPDLRKIVKEPICQRRKSENPVSLCPDFSLESDLAKVQNTFRSNLKKKFECLYEVTSNERNPTLLNEIYTELYITESESGEISNEHEVRQIETQSRRTATEETPIKCKDIFKPLPEQDKHIRSVLTKGVAGIGKTVSVQKFILDWAEEKENKDVHLIFPLPFREINLMKDKTLSLLDLLHLFFPATKEMEIFNDKYKVLFIFDGLDECRLSLDFHSIVRFCDVSESTSVDVMLTNLIKGNLFPSALIWITSRPAAANFIPSDCVDRVTEVRGFSDPQKEEYFRKRISNKSLSDQIISHLKSSRSLYIMCHIPVFCWISVTVLKSMLSETERREIPKTLTQMYTHFLKIQTNIKNQKDYEKKIKDEDMIFKLGKLAFEQLVKGNLIFYDEDLRECGIDGAEASVYSGLCTQIFREEFGLYQVKVYCFVHLSIQEHLAALYAHISFSNNNRNVFIKNPNPTQREKASTAKFHQRAIDETLQSENGHLDLFLRFLLGLSLESNQNLIRTLMTQTHHSSHSNEKTIEYIKKKIRSTQSPEKSINLFHCLNELGDHSLVEEIQRHLKSKKLSEAKLSSSQWSAVVFVLLTSEQKLNEFNLKDFVKGENKTETLKVLQKLSPVICESRSVQLKSCNITDEGCVPLTLALRSNPSHLRDLDVSLNYLRDSGVKLICDVLKNPDCKLEILKLCRCNITAEGCVALTSALRSNPSHLTHLNLSENKLRDSGVKVISDVLKNPDCKLKILELWGCNMTGEGCVALTSALRSNPSHLTHLDLSYNEDLRDSGVKLICDVLKNPDCKLEILGLRKCNITDEGCVALTSALRSNPSHLRDLDLTDNNNLRDSGVKLISDALKNPDCKLEILELERCKISDEGCVALTSALRSNPSHLRDLKLSDNKLTDSGVKLISDVLKNPDCKLEILELERCKITDEGCVALTSALRSNPSHLRDLKLSDNDLRDSGVKLISDVLKNLDCKLEKLDLERCKITDEGCVALNSALRSNPSHLRDLKLTGNNLGVSGVKLISDLKDDPHNKLETVGPYRWW